MQHEDEATSKLKTRIENHEHEHSTCGDLGCGFATCTGHCLRILQLKVTIHCRRLTKVDIKSVVLQMAAAQRDIYVMKINEDSEHRIV